MSAKNKILSVVDVILRIPPLFVIDEVLKFSSDVISINNNSIEITETLSSAANSDANTTVSTLSNDAVKAILYEFLLLVLFKFMLCLLIIIFALGIFILWRQHLLVVYTYFVSLGIILVSFWMNVRTQKFLTNWSIWSNDYNVVNFFYECSSLKNIYLFINKIYDSYLTNDSNIHYLINNILIQLFLGILFKHIHLAPRRKYIQIILPFTFVVPSLLYILPISVPESVISHAPGVSIVLPLVICTYIIWYNIIHICHVLFNGYQHVKTFATNYGIGALLESEWTRLKVPTVLRTFFMIRLIENTTAFVLKSYEYKNIHFVEMFFNYDFLIDVGKNALVTGSETLIAVLGMTSIVSLICHYIGLVFIWFLKAPNADRTFGTVSAILFYILALQTGLTSLDPDKRFIRLCRNFGLLITAMLHFIHNIVSPIMMSLSALQAQSMNRHIRALTVCFFLITFPICLLYYLWNNYLLTTWLLAVTSFSLEVIVKVIVTFLSYALFMIDSLTPTLWDRVDDYNYYLKAFGNSVEFLFGIFLFFNGAWILFFESGGAIRAIMMCIHAYFNIWSEAREGWAVFMRRRTAVNKINSLAEATIEQLQRLNDVCAICYSQMVTAKITKCNHFFHSACLRRWLHVQDRCPLCHEILYHVDNDEKVKEIGLIEQHE